MTTHRCMHGRWVCANGDRDRMDDKTAELQDDDDGRMQTQAQDDEVKCSVLLCRNVFLIVLELSSLFWADAEILSRGLL